MKKRFFVLLIFWFSFIAILGQCDGDIILTTQAEIDAFPQTYGCSVIEGNLLIGYLTGVNLTDITNLNGLSELVNITGTLQIAKNPNLSDLTGLENLSSIGTSIHIEKNNLLESLTGLESLESLSELIIESNPLLVDFTGLENLSSLTHLTVYENENIVNFVGLENITLLSSLFVRENLNLIDFTGLDNITTIGSIKVEQNESLTSFLGLEQVTIASNFYESGSEIKIVENQSLKTIKLTNVTSVEQDVVLGKNPNLEKADFSNLVEVGGSFTDEPSSFSSSNQIDTLDIRNLELVEEELYLRNIAVLILENLQSVGTDFSIGNIATLVTLELNDLVSVGGDFTISYLGFQGLDTLQTIKLINLTSVGGSFIIERNNQLVSIEVPTLVSIGGNFSIERNNALVSIDIPTLVSIGGSFSIERNDELVSIDMPTLVSIEGSFVIEYNDQLVSIEVPNLGEIGSNLNVRNNPTLSECCDLAALADVTEWGVSFSGNATPCNSIELIIFFCAGGEVQIQVQTFLDENGNNIFDDSEQFLIQPLNLEPDAAIAFADQVGITHFYLTEFGTYSISYDQDNLLWSYDDTLESIQIDFLDTTFQDTLLYWPMIPMTNLTSQHIDLTSNATRCSQLTNYWLTYTNEGTTITDGFVELTHDELCLLDSANPPVDSVANGKFYWFYENLYPTHSNQIQLVFEMPPLNDLGESIDFAAQVQTNEGLHIDKAVLSSELICTDHSNDKLATPYGYGIENYTLFGDTLEYTIRFQNTGNDTAFTVIIEDELSPHLNLSTFHPIASSHNVETQINIESRLAKFIFKDIYLPDSFTNEPNSHGFVKYRILGNDNLYENTLIKNTASIFFDQNPPIITNTVSNQMVSGFPSLPVIAATPNELIFDEVNLSEPVFIPQILTIQNLGDLPLEIESFIFENPVFNSNQVEMLTIEGQSGTEVPIYFEPTMAGNYQSTLTLKSNNGDLNISLTGTAVLETSVEAIKQTQFTIFPNPNNGQFYLKSDSKEILSVNIYNSLGELVLSETVESNFKTINLANQSKGLYFMSIQDNEGTFVEKIVIQ